MNERSSRSFRSIGIASVVLIFVMLCLITFAVLSLMTARSDLDQSRRLADRITVLNEAENAAGDILLSVVHCIDANLDAADADAFYRAVRSQLEGADGIAFTDDAHLSFDVPCGEEQRLHVAVELSYEKYPDGSRYRILAWNTEVAHEWDPDTPLPLYEPE